MHYFDYITSDLHIGHSNIRGWRGVGNLTQDEHDDLVIDRYNSVVGEHDNVLIIGDVVMGQMKLSLPKVKRLKGYKYLVPGNHDRNWAGNPKRVTETHDWPAEYEAAGLSPLLPGNMDICGIPGTVRVDHFPYYGDHTAEIRYPQWRPADEGLWLVHGHIHEQWKQNCKQINVGVDAWGGFPVNPDDITSLMGNDLAFIPANRDWA